MRLVDPDGHEVVRTLQADFSADVSPESDDEGALQMVVELGNVTFSGAGPHAVDILIDDRYEETVPLRIKVLKP